MAKPKPGVRRTEPAAGQTAELSADQSENCGGESPLKRYAVHYTHSLLGERIIEAASEQDAVEKYNSLCAGFRSEHPPTVRCLTADESLAAAPAEVAAVVPPNGLDDGVDLNAAVGVKQAGDSSDGQSEPVAE